MSFGRLDRHGDTPPMSDINMTPLIDVMLVLLVIFIITAPLLSSAIRLDLPHSEAALPNSSASGAMVVVDKAGAIHFRDRPITPEALAREFDALVRQDPDAELLLRADTGVPYGRIVEVMGIAQKAGLERIGFVADPVPAPR